MCSVNQLSVGAAFKPANRIEKLRERICQFETHAHANYHCLSQLTNNFTNVTNLIYICITKLIKNLFRHLMAVL